MSSIGKLMKQAARMQQQIEQNPGRARLPHRRGQQRRRRGQGRARCDSTAGLHQNDPQAVKSRRRAIAEDMILTAVNNALEESKKISGTEMGKATQGFNLPGM